jgi:hypothetical protein
MEPPSETAYDCERIPEFMGYSLGHLAYCGKPFGYDQLLSFFFQFCRSFPDLLFQSLDLNCGFPRRVGNSYGNTDLVGDDIDDVIEAFVEIILFPGRRHQDPDRFSFNLYRRDCKRLDILADGAIR